MTHPVHFRERTRSYRQFASRPEAARLPAHSFLSIAAATGLPFFGHQPYEQYFSSLALMFSSQNTAELFWGTDQTSLCAFQIKVFERSPFTPQPSRGGHTKSSFLLNVVLPPFSQVYPALLLLLTPQSSLERDVALFDLRLCTFFSLQLGCCQSLVWRLNSFRQNQFLFQS